MISNTLPKATNTEQVDTARLRKKARWWAVGAAITSLPLLFFAYLFGSIPIILLGGGTFGGYGTASQPPNSPWATIATALMLIALVAIDLWIGMKVYRRRLRKYFDQLGV